MRKTTVEELRKKQLPPHCVVVNKETGKQVQRRTDSIISKMRDESIVLTDDDENVPIIMADIHQDNTLVRFWLS